MTTQILFFYGIGIVVFMMALEEISEKKQNNFIFMGLSAFINLIGYYLSYSDSSFTTTAYFALLLFVFSVIILLYWSFMEVKEIVNDDYKEDKEDD